MKIILTFCLIIAGSDALTTVTGYKGRSVKIKCRYEPGYEHFEKHLIRGTMWHPYKDIPVHSGSPAKDTRFSLYDNRATKVFTVTITDLRAEDANTYWCGIEQPGLYQFKEIQLVIMDVPPSSTVSQSTRTTYSASTHPSVHPETPPATDVTGLSTYLLISAGAVVFAVGVIIVMFYCMHCKIIFPGPVTETQSSKETNEDYVNDHNVLALQAREIHNLPESVYQSLDPTTNQSDSLYQTLNSTNNK
ncbi:CMRF35-like molecule 5 isoform X5 [Silurus meridionalis]|uniref:CMRF35-like molecule 5 isoform X5 n=1 Tax=Silurus meridionalis TaxID=175797 RepID=UPI001EEA4CA0|nr:CMRF35-like molecule 5 isoform X5 [Silurus meridionalis]